MNTPRADVVKMAEWLNAHLKAVGVSTQLVDLRKTHDGRGGIPFAPQIGNDKASLSMDISTFSL